MRLLEVCRLFSSILFFSVREALSLSTKRKCLRAGHIKETSDAIGKIMNLERLEYIKSVSHPDGHWSYEKYRKGSYFPLNFKQGLGVDTHAANLPTGALILLSQAYQGERYLSHVVEIVNNASEDQLQWDSSDWGIVRWVKVIWSAEPSTAPLDKDVLDVNWGWYNTKAKSLDSQSLMTRWKTLDALKSHLSNVLVETEKRQLTPV